MAGTDDQIRLADVNKAYGPHVVLSERALTVGGGEFVVVTGTQGTIKNPPSPRAGGIVIRTWR